MQLVKILIQLQCVLALWFDHVERTSASRASPLLLSRGSHVKSIATFAAMQTTSLSVCISHVLLTILRVFVDLIRE